MQSKSQSCIFISRLNTFDSNENDSHSPNMHVTCSQHERKRIFMLPECVRDAMCNKLVFSKSNVNPHIETTILIGMGKWLLNSVLSVLNGDWDLKWSNSVGETFAHTMRFFWIILLVLWRIDDILRTKRSRFKCLTVDEPLSTPNEWTIYQAYWRVEDEWWCVMPLSAHYRNSQIELRAYSTQLKSCPKCIFFSFSLLSLPRHLRTVWIAHRYANNATALYAHHRWNAKWPNASASRYQ